jgi:hypothetical protein
MSEDGFNVIQPDKLFTVECLPGMFARPLAPNRVLRLSQPVLKRNFLCFPK